nr:MAG TPA: hypothetical protein [Caudoviricetes sp.]
MCSPTFHSPILLIFLCLLKSKHLCFRNRKESLKFSFCRPIIIRRDKPLGLSVQTTF